MGWWLRDTNDEINLEMRRLLGGRWVEASFFSVENRVPMLGTLVMGLVIGGIYEAGIRSLGFVLERKEM